MVGTFGAMVRVGDVFTKRGEGAPLKSYTANYNKSLGDFSLLPDGAGFVSARRTTRSSSRALLARWARPLRAGPLRAA